MNITVHYGIEETTKYFPGDNVSVGEVIGNSTIRASLGYGDKVKGLVDGVELPTTAQLNDGDHLHIEVKANEKAVTRADLQAAVDKAVVAIDNLQDTLYAAVEQIQSMSR